MKFVARMNASLPLVVADVHSTFAPVTSCKVIRLSPNDRCTWRAIFGLLASLAFIRLARK